MPNFAVALSAYNAMYNTVYTRAYHSWKPERERETETETERERETEQSKERQRENDIIGQRDFSLPRGRRIPQCWHLTDSRHSISAKLRHRGSAWIYN